MEKKLALPPFFGSLLIFFSLVVNTDEVQLLFGKVLFFLLVKLEEEDPKP